MERPTGIYICSIWRSLLLSADFLELSEFPCGDFRPGLPRLCTAETEHEKLHTCALGGGHISSR
jgi:hypothetical protein